MDGIDVALLWIGGLAGNAGWMMLTGRIPGPPGQWLFPTGGVLVLVSVQALVLLVNRDALFPRNEAASDAVEEVDA